MTVCEHLDELRDYALGELPAAARSGMESHIAECADCAAELQALKITTAALRSLPDQEVPRRIGFVSDPVFEPSPAARWFAGFWNSAARLGFASACVLAVGLIVSSYHRQPAVSAPMQVAQSGVTKAEVEKEIGDAVAKAVAQVRAQVQAEDAEQSAKALDAADRKHEEEHRALLVAMEENMTVLQKRLSTYTILASADAPSFGGVR